MICPTCGEAMLTEHPHQHPGRQSYSDDERTLMIAGLLRKAYETHMATKQREKYRQEHIAIVLDAFKVATWTEGKTWLDLATVAVDALLADGVAFVRFNRSDEKE